jgi:4-carboxymuconolactone decarboxylase
MNELNDLERELVALGAAMGSNCISCIEYHIPEARKAGLTDSQISEAIRLADKVRQVPARKVLNTAQRMLPELTAGISGGSNPVETAQAAATGRACCS